MTTIPTHLTHQERAAVAHLLRFSALAFCPGVDNRIILDGHDLTLQRLDEWGWSSGELVLIDVLRFVIGQEVRWPGIGRVDDLNQQVIREALRFLALDEARLEATR